MPPIALPLSIFWVNNQCYATQQIHLALLAPFGSFWPVLFDPFIIASFGCLSSSPNVYGVCLLCIYWESGYFLGAKIYTVKSSQYHPLMHYTLYALYTTPSQTYCKGILL